MLLDTYQERCAVTALYPNVGSNLSYPIIGLGGEAGEVLNELKRVSRDDGGLLTDERRERIVSELGDVMWYVAAAATELGVSLSEVAGRNLSKLGRRMGADCVKGHGDDR